MRELRKFRRLRPAGGHKTHLVEEKTARVTGSGFRIPNRRALCGYQPGGNTNMGSKRAKWTNNLVCLGEMPCEACQKAYDALEESRAIVK